MIRELIHSKSEGGEQCGGINTATNGSSGSMILFAMMADAPAKKNYARGAVR